MRIGMMADMYKPHVSGITTYISLNKKFLEKKGHEVYVFTFSDESYKDDEPNVIRSPGMPLLATGYYFSFNYSRQARRVLSAMEVVHIHHPFLSGSLALRYCRPRGIPLIFTNHTRYDLYSQAYLPVMMADVISSVAVQAYLPAFCRACDLVVSPSPGMRDVLVGFGVDVPIIVAPNGVDLEPFQQPVDPVDRAKFGFCAEDVVLVYVGRLGPEKNLQFLLRSFAGTSQAYDQARLLLIGGGPDRETLEDLSIHLGIRDKVFFVGMLPYEEVPAYLAMADAFVTASVTEVHPMTVIEAMGAGLPVLGIQSPGVGDTIQDGETGYIVSSEDLASFTAMMVRLVREDEQRRRMGESARKAADAFAIERTCTIVEGLYKQAIELAHPRKNFMRARLMRWMDTLRK